MCLYNSAIYFHNITFSIYYIASKSNQVCLWLPYVLNTTYSFPFCCGRRSSGLYWRDDVCSAVYRYYFCTNCTNTQCSLRRRTFASWVILIGCAKTDGPITGNITGSFCICLLANTAWPSYVVLHDRLAINIIYCDIRGDYRELVRYGNRGQITVHNISYIYLLRDRASFPWNSFSTRLDTQHANAM